VLLSNVFDRHQARVRCYHGANSNITRAGVLIPKFVSLHGIRVYKLSESRGHQQIRDSGVASGSEVRM